MSSRTQWTIKLSQNVIQSSLYKQHDIGHAGCTDSYGLYTNILTQKLFLHTYINVCTYLYISCVYLIILY